MPDQTRSVLIGALVVALLSTSYLSLINCFCCAGVIIGAMVSVWHYTSTNSLTIEAGRGAVFGVLAAALGSLVAIVINYMLTQMGLDANAAVAETLIRMFGDFMPPEQLDQMRAQVAQQQDVSLGQQLISGLFGVVVASIFGAIGGVIGASLFKKGDGGESTASNGLVAE